MAYQIALTSKALKQLKKLGKSKENLFRPILEALAKNPRPPGATKLKGSENEYRVRVGDYRIVYSVQDAMLLVTVIKVAHRREVYRK
ncbi:MAG: type II toxin-antitoxin system RelE/ParE family toxin [Cyanobacteria bacterium P01_H01_bin.74]